MKKYEFTKYFELKVLSKRSYLKKEWCIEIVENPIKVEMQKDKERYRFWGLVPEFDNKVFRVVTLKDRKTIHNAFPDRSLKK